MKLLHIAPEKCLSFHFNNYPNITYLGADINPDYADIQMDITNIPYGENEIDYIICSHVLGHIPDEKKAISELYRVLSLQGTVFALTLIDLDNPDTFETTDADFGQRLEAEGFRVEAIDYRLNFDAKIREKYSLGDGKREVIFKYTKPASF